jgi:succinate dehydrogenase / fumarate reductase flavoprotein subunit
MLTVNIIGAGLAGLSAAITLAESGVSSRLISLQPSERAQSVLAEGGINGALNTMGEGDTPEQHYADTMRGGVWLADPNAVANLTNAAPEILRWLEGLGVPFNRTETDISLRNFGGQRLKRTAYARSSTGKIIMHALIDEARKYEQNGLIQRFPHHDFLRLLTHEDVCTGVRVQDVYSGRMYDLSGAVLLCTGGMNGIFPGSTTGTTQNTGNVTATVFSQGVTLGNLEMLQYHPTTIVIAGKRCLVTEAARGEGGRLFIERGGKRWYFMEELYPDLGNLSPRDVVARTMFFVRRHSDTGNQVYLDLTKLPDSTWENRLCDLRQELLHYLLLDPKTSPIPVQEGIHYFMGGILTDDNHRTNLKFLLAAGECTCQYHGANRLGGNSMLGALYGGRRAAETLLQEQALPESDLISFDGNEPLADPVSPMFIRLVSEILLSGLGIVRNEEQLAEAIMRLEAVKASSPREENHLHLAEAMLRSALERRESRGAHYREDYPELCEDMRKTTAAQYDQKVSISFCELPERRNYADTNGNSQA